jgi:hypothetical protein
MKDLIERLENATGPDRVLDGDIALALMLVPRGMERGWEAGWSGGGEQFHAEWYTSSIDAALTLFGNLNWQVGVFNLDRIPRAEIAETIMTKYGPGIGIRAQAKGATPAIALCIACLRARMK